ncbi:MAG: glucose-1-phosphate thymidylyltransferase RfbA [Thermodesulfovibrionales bacterium]|nr:glucose-1-phosphate thymidylyltransferase RfbA [Thermodesulfovibrionales bacterium]
MKGIILAGGSGTRLYPATIPVNKHLLNIYDKPMIYYPLSVLLLAGCREILIISTPKDISRFEELFGDGSKIGIKFYYSSQKQAKGIAEALIIGEDFINRESVWLILGDNFFFGHGLHQLLKEALIYHNGEGATVFAYPVSDPHRYGVIEFEENGKVLSLEEKPLNPKSDYAVTGLYLYDNKASELAKTLKPSSRGELEITDLNKLYLQRGLLKVKKFGRGYTWIDAGTFDSLHQASDFVRIIEKRQSFKIACIEEIVYRLGYITKEQLLQTIAPLKNSGYGKYIMKIIEDID